MDIEPERVIELVKDRRVGERLLKHERNKLIINTSGSYYYLDSHGKHRLLHGLLPQLKRTYWPNSNYFKLLKKSNAPGVVKGRKKGKRGGGKFQGVIKGSKVHRELKDFVQLDSKNFKKLHSSLHNYSGRLLKVILEKLKCRPFLPEFDLFDERLGIGTSVDMICLDAEGNLVLFEFKTGYKGYFDNADGFMECSLKNLRNTCQNQASLQVSAAAIILERRYGIPLDKMKLFVLRIDEDSLDIIPVQNEFIKKIGPCIYQDLLTNNINNNHK